ncbi:hypothetical protein QTP70_002127 [Hemibagrus guttatus]|uniref:Integrase core domain-containing protein n=1 Tax=Hemibagrus guttatus TaxID=175788 RepID=A0AAE0V2S2_9TELE|nr:hypothetical protein QTP70_002127 [Hemibagrus guttatus]
MIGTYSVSGPREIMHIDTNQKLIRYNIVIFGDVDGFSWKIMYLGAAPNNLASTTLAFFQDAVENFGFSIRVRADQGVENVDVARLMFTVRETDRGSFISEILILTFILCGSHILGLRGCGVMSGHL